MPRPHSPSFLLCQEHYSFTFQQHSQTLSNTQPSPLTFPDNLQHDLLLSLLSKQRATHSTLSPRHHVVRLISKLSNFHGFSPLTTVLAVNYFDRFVATLRFQSELKPWMTQLTAVACVSLAAKVEETRVPLLSDFQVRFPTSMFANVPCLFLCFLFLVFQRRTVFFSFLNFD